jgi:hypothetical protein
MSVVTAGIVVIGLGVWLLVKRKTFTGPNVSFQMLNQINAETVTGIEARHERGVDVNK